MVSPHEKPVIFIAEKEIPPLLKLSVGFLCIYRHGLVKLLIDLNPVLGDADIHFRAELPSDTTSAQGCGRELIGRVLLKNGHRAIEFVVHEAIGNAGAHDSSTNDENVKAKGHGSPPGAWESPR